MQTIQPQIDTTAHVKTVAGGDAEHHRAEDQGRDDDEELAEVEAVSLTHAHHRAPAIAPPLRGAPGTADPRQACTPPFCLPYATGRGYSHSRRAAQRPPQTSKLPSSATRALTPPLDVSTLLAAVGALHPATWTITSMPGCSGCATGWMRYKPYGSDSARCSAAHRPWRPPEGQRGIRSSWVRYAGPIKQRYENRHRILFQAFARLRPRFCNQ